MKRKWAEWQWVSVRSYVAIYTSDIDLLKKLMTDEDWEVREAVALNPALTSDMLREMKNDTHKFVLSAILKHDKTPKDVKAEVAERLKTLEEEKISA